MHAEDVMSALARGHSVQKKARLDRSTKSDACTSAMHLVNLFICMCTMKLNLVM